MEKTSLEKSHSKWSNFKLTILCLFITIIVSCIWIVICFINYFKLAYFVLILLGLLLLLILFIYLLIKFKR